MHERNQFELFVERSEYGTWNFCDDVIRVSLFLSCIMDSRGAGSGTHSVTDVKFNASSDAQPDTPPPSYSSLFDIRVEEHVPTPRMAGPFTLPVPHVPYSMPQEYQNNDLYPSQLAWNFHNSSHDRLVDDSALNNESIGAYSSANGWLVGCCKTFLLLLCFVGVSMTILYLLAVTFGPHNIEH